MFIVGGQAALLKKASVKTAGKLMHPGQQLQLLEKVRVDSSIATVSLQCQKGSPERLAFFVLLGSVVTTTPKCRLLRMLYAQPAGMKEPGICWQQQHWGTIVATFSTLLSRT